MRARRGEPLDLAQFGLAAAMRGTLQETAAAHDRVITAQVDKVTGEVQELVIMLVQIPVDPRQLVVLAVHVVVASLSAAQLVAVGDHRDTLGEHEGRQEVALLTVAQLDDFLVIRVALDAAVPRTVVVCAIRAALEVCLVVLFVVRDEVAQREAIVGNDEVDGRHWLATRRPVQVGGASQAGGEVGERGEFAAPEVAHRIAVPAVPLGPQGREAADLVAVRTHVPRLRDELDLRDHGVLVDEVEESGESVDLGELAGQSGGQVEAEAVHMHLRDPVAQRVHDELQDLRRAHEEGISCARRIEVVPTIPVDEAVVGGIVDTPEGEGGTHVVTLCRVVVDDVEDDLNVGGVQGLHHRLELGDLRAGILRGSVIIVRSKVTDRVVAPVVRQSLGLQRRVIRELLDRHQLNRGDAQLCQVLDDRGVCHACVGAAQVLRDVRVAHRHALDVGLVDD